jgi:hypothetical protein
LEINQLASLKKGCCGDHRFHDGTIQIGWIVSGAGLIVLIKVGVDGPGLYNCGCAIYNPETFPTSIPVIDLVEYYG